MLLSLRTVDAQLSLAAPRQRNLENEIFSQMSLQLRTKKQFGLFNSEDQRFA
jgi:hypothetical protein